MTEVASSEIAAPSRAGVASQQRSRRNYPATGARSLSASGLPLSVDENGPILVRYGRGKLLAKRTLDVVIALSALLVLGPLLAVAAAAIRLTSRGPILFSQYRLGLDGATFRIYKFRTFEVDECDPSGRSQTVANDPRVMPIGRFLRRTSIDELPQLLNVLKGDMSIVGPRPHVAGQYAAGMAYDELVPYYFRRNAVRPGITGWAQVNGFRGPTTDEAMARGRVDHDIAYIQNFSIALDLWIIVLTIWREFVTGRGV